LTRKLTEKFEDVINSHEFQEYCYEVCPHRHEGCRHDCVFFHFRLWLSNRSLNAEEG